MKFDAASFDDNKAVVDAAMNKWGKLDIAVNNAGIGGRLAPLVDLTPENFREVMSTNLDSIFYGMKHQIPAMIKNGGGSIINIASILGAVGCANASPYVSAKHAILGMSKAAAIENGTYDFNLKFDNTMLILHVEKLDRNHEMISRG